MTIEEKAKAYDEAIERAKVFKKHLLEIDEKDYADEMDYIFSGLKESENEVLRKELLNAFKEATDSLYMVLTPLKREAFIAWLEKQGEQNTIVVIPKFRVGDVIRPIGSMAEYTIESISGECYYGKGWGLHISCDNDYELVEQKPAEWSEEDEANLDYLINFCNGYYNGNKPVLTESTARSLSNWLYRLKSCEIMPNTNKIDNEEAEKTIHLACEFIRHRMESNGNIGGVDYAELIKRLKSLRPQSTWKPSDEQMKAMQKALVDLCGKDEHNIITGLYYNLKKLREE